MFRKSFWLFVLAISLLPFSAAAAWQNGIEVEFEGRVDDIRDDETIVVDEFSVDVSSLDDRDDLEEGLVIRVEGTLLPGGEIEAEKITLLALEDDELEIKGAVLEMDDDTLRIGRQMIRITDAEFEDDIAVGDAVIVRARISDDNDDTLVASRVERLDDSAFDDDTIEIIGYLREFDDDSMVISGWTVNGRMVGMNDDQLNTLVKIQLQVEDQQLSVVTVRDFDDDDGDDSNHNNSSSSGDDDHDDGDDSSHNNSGNNQSDDSDGDDSGDDSHQSSDSSDDNGGDDSGGDDSGGDDDNGDDSGDD